MRRFSIPILIAIGGLGALPACRPPSNQVGSGTPAENERKQMKGLGQHGWASEAVVDLLKEGEAQVDWNSPNQGPMVPIIIDLDAEGKVFVTNEEYAPERLRKWLAELAENFGSVDPVIIRPKTATPLAALESTAAVVLESGWTQIFMVADNQLQRAYSVRLNGKAVRITPIVDIP